MTKYVLIMVDNPDSPVRWHCAFDAENTREALAFATRAITDGHTFHQAVELLLQGERLAILAPVTGVEVSK